MQYTKYLQGLVLEEGLQALVLKSNNSSTAYGVHFKVKRH
jgi:hypothetical protein